MRKLLLATAAVVALTASPAAARDGSGYLGLEFGALFPNESDLDVDLDPTDDDDTDVFDSGVSVDYKTGYDVDLIGGYDFGMFRLEGELGYKRAKLDQFELSDELRDIIEADIGGPILDEDLDLDGHVSVTSGMVNALLDFGGDAGFGAFVGGGVGFANVDLDIDDGGDSDSAFAWQLLAGVRTAISDNIDIGLKYRFFRTGRLNFNDQFDFDDEPFETGLTSRFSSHSLLLSLVYNFAPPAPALAPLPPPPPPPPAAPATQTCPDGSVILATSTCPLPPPPPPPPPPSAGERGR